MAGAAGFEPTITGSKPDALPLGYAPIDLKKGLASPREWAGSTGIAGAQSPAAPCATFSTLLAPICQIIV